MQSAASVAPQLGSFLLTMLGLFLLRRVIRTGRKDGLFVDATADRIRDLGWFLVGYAVVWPLVVSAAGAVIVDSVVRGAHWAAVLLHPDLSFAMVVVALGVLSMSRILRHAVPMQEEIDATV